MLTRFKISSTDSIKSLSSWSTAPRSSPTLSRLRANLSPILISLVRISRTGSKGSVNFWIVSKAGFTTLPKNSPRFTLTSLKANLVEAFGWVKSQSKSRAALTEGSLAEPSKLVTRSRLRSAEPLISVSLSSKAPWEASKSKAMSTLMLEGLTPSPSWSMPSLLGLLSASSSLILTCRKPSSPSRSRSGIPALRKILRSSLLGVSKKNSPSALLLKSKPKSKLKLKPKSRSAVLPSLTLSPSPGMPKSDSRGISKERPVAPRLRLNLSSLAFWVMTRSSGEFITPKPFAPRDW